jgi:hypothetical protein
VPGIRKECPYNITLQPVYFSLPNSRTKAEATNNPSVKRIKNYAADAVSTFALRSKYSLNPVANNVAATPHIAI